MDALARLQPARALALSGDTANAKRALRGSLDAVEECRPRHSGSGASTSGVRQITVIDMVFLRPPSMLRGNQLVQGHT
jgi:hypothetical protein